MQQLGQCPVCGTALSSEKVCGQVVICECGWTKSIHSNQAESKLKDRTILTMVLVSALFVGSFIHAINWDRYFFDIIPLKAKEITKMATAEDYKALIAICSSRAKSDCVEKAYQNLYRLLPHQIEVLAELGHLQFLRSDMHKAVQTLKLYFASGGKSIEATYDYARALSQVGLYDEALKQFQYVLRSKPQVFQISVARTYILTLIKHNKLPQAKAAIEYYRKNSTSSAFFMDPEYRLLSQMLRGDRKVAGSS